MSSRREFLRFGGVCAGIGALGLTVPEMYSAEKFPGDVAILNVALGLEHEAIAAYQAGAESQLLSADQLSMALAFQKDHKRHRDTLSKFVRRFGGTAVEAKSQYDFGTITSAADILKLAQRLEQGAADAYLTHAAKLESREVLDAAAQVLVDEVRHTTVLKLLLGLPVTERPKY